MTILPLVADGLSDSGTFDNCLELLMISGYSPAQAAALMIPEAWQGHSGMDPKRSAFYQHHAIMMEPWDGPALITFTDGRQVGALLDRNGLRPARYIETSDNRVIMASEVGVIAVEDKDIVHKWRLEPGRMLLVDMEKGRIVSDEDVKDEMASAAPFEDWVSKYQIKLGELPKAQEESMPKEPGEEELLCLQQANGYNLETLEVLARAHGLGLTGAGGSDGR